jgi:hypothetical protein
MEGIFLFRPDKGKINPYNKTDFDRYLLQNEGIELIGHFEESANSSEKMKLYAFFNGPILDCAMIGFRKKGYTGDKVVCAYRLLAELAKKTVVNPNGKVEVMVMRQSDMSMKRYHQFVSDALLFLEEELEMEVPDAQTYKDLLFFKAKKEQKNRK